MTYRYLDIFDDSRTPAPDRSEVRRQCKRWIDDAIDGYNALIISAKVNTITEPFLREYTASIMHDVVVEQMADEDCAYCFSQQIVEQIERDLQRIVKKARYEQTGLEYDTGDTSQATQTDSAIESRLNQLEVQVGYLIAQFNQRRSPCDTDYCMYIVPNEIKSFGDIEAELCKVAEKDAPALGSYLERAARLGYLNFGKDSRRTIYDTLRDRYHLPYSYDNFRRYFNH